MAFISQFGLPSEISFPIEHVFCAQSERFVAESLGVAPRAVRVAKGASGRDKVLEIDLDAAELEARLRTMGDGKTS